MSVRKKEMNGAVDDEVGEACGEGSG